jgi:tRNA (guanosine-2'-O-)-methyltransferase
MDPRDRLPPELRPLARDAADRRIQLCLDLMDRRIPDVTVLLEAVRRRHNVSAILRSAEAFGLHEAHLITNTFRPSVGSAKGAERWLELSLHDNAADCFSALRERGYRIYVADFAPGAASPDELPVDGPLAVLFGTELTGVSEQARALADGVVTIPMTGVTQSLNVSAAASVCLYTLTQRRRQRGDLGIHGAPRWSFVRRFLERESRRKRSSLQLFEEMEQDG